MEVKWLIYKIGFPNGKCYIGLTKNFKKRIQRHRQDTNARIHLPLYGALNKYGWENVAVTIVEDNIPSFQEACKVEKSYIAQNRSYIRNGNGYNCTEGGEGVAGGVPEQVEAFRQAAIERWKDPEYRSKMKSLKRRMDSEVKEKISNSLKETYAKHGHPWTGREISEDTRLRMTIAAKGRNARRIYCSDLQFVFLSITDCANYFKVTKQAIIKSLNAKNSIKYKSLTYYDTKEN